MMKLDTTKHVKIWISKDPDEPLGARNELRLIRHRVKHPHHTIHLVTDMTRLSLAGIIKLQKFAARHSIILHPISELPIRSAREAKLMKYVQRELTEYWGNPAAASDMLRWFKSVLSLGIYSDFDREMDFRGLPHEIEIQDFLVSNDDSDKADAEVASDVLAFPQTEHPVIDAMQEQMLHAYTNASPDLISSRQACMDVDESLISDSIIETTGPMVLRRVLKQFYAPSDLSGDTTIRRETWRHDVLPLDSILLEKSPLAGRSPFRCDNSWLSHGEQIQKVLNSRMDLFARKIQFFYRNYKDTQRVQAKRQRDVAAPTASNTEKRVKL